MRAIGFCVSVQHAHYMAEVFNRAGIGAVAVDGSTDAADRAAALNRLAAREINCIFAVDLFNEGLDRPQVDTILMLRPTQSATIFLQQLGRGLRRSEGKTVLTVLDFIGQQHHEFRFDLRYRAFPYLSSGSQIVLDRVAQKVVLNNIKAQLRFNRAQLVRAIASYAETELEAYLERSGNDLKSIYRSTRDSLTVYLRQGGLIDGYSPLETVLSGRIHELSDADGKKLLGRMAALIHVDDPERADAYSMLVGADAPAMRSSACESRRSRACCSTRSGTTAAVPVVRRRLGLSARLPICLLRDPPDCEARNGRDQARRTIHVTRNAGFWRKAILGCISKIRRKSGTDRSLERARMAMPNV